MPASTRSRIVLELAADLESLMEHYRARGLTEDEAARLAEEKLLLSPAVLQELVAVHTSGYERWASRAAGRLRWGLDAALFAVAVLPMAALAAWVVAGRLPGPGGAPLLLPLLAVAATVVAIAASKAWQLFVRRERSPARLHRGLPTLVLLGVLGPALGMLAGLVGLYGLAMELSSRPPDAAAQLALVEQAGRQGTLVGLGLLLGLAAGLVWFVLVNRVAAIEEAESAALLGGE